MYWVDMQQKACVGTWIFLAALLVIAACSISTSNPSGLASTRLGSSQIATPASLNGSFALPTALDMVSSTIFLPIITRSSGVEIGAFVGVNPPTTLTVQTFESLVGRHIYSVRWYLGWDAVNQPPFPATDLSAVRFHDGYDTGVIPHLTWEPWVPLTNVISGTYDAYLTSYAIQVKNWGRPVRLRFAHEMIQNNSLDGHEWYPWQDQPEQYKSAFRHVHDVFHAAGANNAEFVWCPQNYPFDLNIVELYYPGADYVDWLCMDGYNSANPWQWFDDIFYNLYHTFVDHPEVFGVKSVMIGEFASCEAGPNQQSWETKPAWIQNTFERMKSADYSRIRAFYWFHINKECNWRADSSPQSLTAFKTGIGAAVFVSHPVSGTNR